MGSLAALLVCAGASQTAQIRVDLHGSGDYLTIQEGVAAASSGDTVWVAPGTYGGPYNRDVVFGGRAILLSSESGPETTVIDCEGQGRGVIFRNAETTSSRLHGFTVTHGYAAHGAGILCESASAPLITNCRLVDNIAHGATLGGGGMACWAGSSPTLSDVVFTGNQGDYGGGLLTVAGSAPHLEGVVFDGNSALRRGGGWYCEEPAEPYMISDCAFRDNVATDPSWGYGGALYIFGAAPRITGVTFARNSAGHPTRGDCLAATGGGSLTVDNTILAFGGRGKMYALLGGSTATTANCVVYGNAGGDSLDGTHHDNLFADPRFCDLDGGDLTLCANSPCVLGSHPWPGLVGAYGQGCADCDAPAERRSWGVLKAQFRPLP